MAEFEHVINENGYSNLYGYGMIDLNKALGLNIDSDDLQKLEESEFNNNTALNALNALEAWRAGYTGEGVKIGVIDAGEGMDSEAASHEFPDLTIRIDTVAARGAHGFRVAQYIVAENHLPASLGGNGEKSETGSENHRDVTGVAFDAQLYFADPDLSDLNIHIPGFEEGIFRWFFEQGVDVVNWSGSLGYDKPEHQEALRLAHENGIIVVMAAGNNGAAMDGFRTNDILNYVNDYDNMIVASALRPEDPIELYGFSNHAGSEEHNHFAVLEDYGHAYFPSGEYEKNISGTSFAAPYLAGAVALIIQKLRDEGNYDYEGDYRQVIQLLRDSAYVPNSDNLQQDERVAVESINFPAQTSFDGKDKGYIELTVGMDKSFELIDINQLLEREDSFQIDLQRDGISRTIDIINFSGEVRLFGNIVLKHENDPVIEDAIEIIYTITPSFLENINSPNSETVPLIGQVASLLESSDNIALEIANILYEGNLKRLLQHQANVVYGISTEDSDKIIDDLILSGEFTELSLFQFITDSDTVENAIDVGNLGSFGDSSWVLYQEFDM